MIVTFTSLVESIGRWSRLGVWVYFLLVYGAKRLEFSLQGILRLFSLRHFQLFSICLRLARLKNPLETKIAKSSEAKHIVKTHNAYAPPPLTLSHSSSHITSLTHSLLEKKEEL